MPFDWVFVYIQWKRRDRNYTALLVIEEVKEPEETQAVQILIEHEFSSAEVGGSYRK
jgi:hypothetical protein